MTFVVTAITGKRRALLTPVIQMALIALNIMLLSSIIDWPYLFPQAELKWSAANYALCLMMRPDNNRHYHGADDHRGRGNAVPCHRP